MKHLALSIFILFLQPVITAQTLSGKVIDQKTNAAIPYVNIGIVGRGTGTVSDFEGHFKINMHDSLNGGTIRFSCIGYKPINFNVSDFKKRYRDGGINISMEENVVTLAQVVVKPKVYKTKILGNENNFKGITAGFMSNDLGSELATIMHIKKSPSFIETININIGNNELKQVKFRLNIYNMKDGLPDTILLKEPIFITTEKKSGTLTVDMKKYNLYVENDFLVSLEWIEDYGSNKLYFCAGLMNSNSLYRKTSQDEWHNAKPVGIGINATVIYEK